MNASQSRSSTVSRGSFAEVFRVALRLGLTSFGGLIAHLGYFHQEYVRRRRWLDERSYADLVALCQFLPGPASSQVGMAIGIVRRGMASIQAALAGVNTAVVAPLLAALPADLDRRNSQHGRFQHRVDRLPGC